MRSTQIGVTFFINATYTLGTADFYPGMTDAMESKDVWYRVLGTGGNLTVSLCDPAFTYDSHIAVYASGPGTQECDQSCIIFNDDACDYASEVLWSTEVGLDYLIRVYGSWESVGPFCVEKNYKSYKVVSATTRYEIATLS